jgi:hypothetical protein
LGFASPRHSIRFLAKALRQCLLMLPWLQLRQ